MNQQNQSTKQNQQRVRINWQIKSQEVRVVLDDGSSKVLPIKEAIALAKADGLDLIEVNYKANPRVCKILDHGKYKYEEKKKKSLLKKSQKISELKELSISQTTEENDLSHKLNKAKEFLTDGHKVKFSLKFRGREITHTDIAKEKFLFIIKELEDLTHKNIKPQIALEGKYMSTIICPK